MDWWPYAQFSAFSLYVEAILVKNLKNWACWTRTIWKMGPQIIFPNQSRHSPEPSRAFGAFFGLKSLMAWLYNWGDIISSSKASQMLWNKLFSPSFWNQAYQARSISATNTVPSSTWWVQDLSIGFGCHQSGPYCISQATLLCLSQVIKHQSQLSWGTHMECDDKAQAWWHIGQRACDSHCCQCVCISIN